MQANSEDVLDLVVSHEIGIAQETCEHNLFHDVRMQVNAQLLCELNEFIST